MQKLLVYTNGGGALIGTGWAIHSCEGRTFKPTLISLDGTELPEGWYTLQVTGESFLIVLNRSIH